MSIYVIDTSSLIELHRKNPIDVYPSVWKKLGKLIDECRLVSPREVLNEISKMDDELSEWAKNQPRLFREPNQKQFELVKKILKEFPSIIDVTRPYDADPWVIALAMDLSAQHDLKGKVKQIVVTEEKLAGNKIKIPYICQKYSIDAINIITMFRTEKWTF